MGKNRVIFLSIGIFLILIGSLLVGSTINNIISGNFPIMNILMFVFGALMLALGFGFLFEYGG